MAVSMEDIAEQVRRAAAKRILFLPHAVSQMNAPERMITTREVRTVVFNGFVIENYPRMRAATVA